MWVFSHEEIKKQMMLMKRFQSHFITYLFLWSGVVVFFCKGEKINSGSKRKWKDTVCLESSTNFCVLSIRSFPETKPLPTMHFHKYLLLHRALKQVTVSFSDESSLVYKFQACKLSPQTLKKKREDIWPILQLIFPIMGGWGMCKIRVNSAGAKAPFRKEMW